MKLGTAFPCCQPGEHPGVARATRYAAAVGPLEQRNQVLARETEAVPQHGGGRPAQPPPPPPPGGAETPARRPRGGTRPGPLPPPAPPPPEPPPRPPPR